MTLSPSLCPAKNDPSGHPNATQEMVGCDSNCDRNTTSRFRSRPDLAEQGWIESLAIFDRLGDEHNRAVMLHRLGLSAMLMWGDLDRAEELVKESDEIHRRTEEQMGPGTDDRRTRRHRARSR